MKWFGINLNGNFNFTKVLLVGFAFLCGTFANMSFTNGKNNRNPTDSLQSDKQGFKNLFINNKFDANQPYMAQLNPQAIPFVKDYVRKETKEYERMKVWGKPYFDLYDNILTQYGLPKELKYLSVIESSLTPGLVSWAGAVGPWQLMDYEAKRFGLRVGKGLNDERTDFYKSTHCASKLLKELYGEFNDWLLVIAAYNGGDGRVRQAIKKAGSRNFWDLQQYLPEETRNHVKKFIGTHYIFEGAGGWTTMTAAETETARANAVNVGDATASLTADELANTTIVEVKGRYLASVVSNSLLLDAKDFNKWNPNFDKSLAEGNKYPMRINKTRAQIFEAQKGNILLESIRVLLNGETAAK